MENPRPLWRNPTLRTLVWHGITLGIDCDSTTGDPVWTTSWRPEPGREAHTLGKRTEEPANRLLGDDQKEGAAQAGETSTVIWNCTSGWSRADTEWVPTDLMASSTDTA